MQPPSPPLSGTTLPTQSIVVLPKPPPPTLPSISLSSLTHNGYPGTQHIPPPPPPPPPSSVTHVPPPPPPWTISCGSSPSLSEFKSKRKWEGTAQQNPIDLSRAIRFPLDQQIEWKNIKSVSLSGSGSSGVFFVETHVPNHVVVVKAPFTLAGEIFGAKFAKLLGLTAPSIRVVEYSPNDVKLTRKREWLEMKTNMKEIAEKTNDIACQIKVEKELDRAFFLVMEFVEGAVSLEDLMMVNEELARTLLNNEEVLTDIGRMAILDIICNNCDRFPIEGIWDHDGNATNVLFSSKYLRLVCPDNHYVLMMTTIWMVK